MQKLQTIFEELKQKYEKHQYPKNAPALRWLPIEDSFSENYHAEYAGGIVTIKAHGYLGAIYALNRIHAGISSGHLADFLGLATPYFKIRPLWLENSLKSVFSEPTRIHEFCKRILELGYNAIIVDHGDDNYPKLKALCNNLKSYGLKIILKPLPFQKLESHSPLNKNYSDFVVDYLKKMNSHNICFDYLFWESHWEYPDFISDPQADAYTLPEVVLKEARLLENHLNPNQSLIFYLPCSDRNSAKQSSIWISQIAENLEQRTILAFSAVAGPHWADFLQPHPVWEELRFKIGTSNALFMPIINVGHVKQSEGLWPILVHDSVEEYLSRCEYGQFSGVIALANHLPADGGIHDCNLWVAAQAMWKKNSSVFLLKETWFSAFRKDWDATLCTPLLCQMRHISKQLGMLRFLTHEKNKEQASGQELRVFAESILAQLNDIQLRLEKEEEKGAREMKKLH